MVRKSIDRLRVFLGKEVNATNYKSFQCIPSLALLKNLKEDPFVAVCDSCEFTASVKAVLANLIHCRLDVIVRQ